MWKYFSGILLRNKLAFTIGVLLLTVFMGYEASKMQLSYEFAKILPDTDSTFIEYQNFKKKFGEDGNVMVMGFADKDLFQLEKFKDWTKLNNDLKNIQGVKAIMSLPTAYKLVKNDSLEKFDFVPLIQNPITSQKEVDSLKNEFLNMPFYEGIIYNKESGANLVAITFTKKDLDSKRRLEMVKEIKELGDAFSKKHNTEMHYSGMPYIRSQLMTKVRAEMTLFLILAIIVTAIIL
jgi:predicted RND superfamily exporter protein